jgi:hypothetical protein
VEKFDCLVGGRVNGTLSQQIKEAVCTLEDIQVKDLMGPRTRVQV